MKPDVAVVILAGGEGRRIGGGKPLRALRGKPLIDYAIEQARRWSDVVRVAARNEHQTPSYEAILIGDEPGVEGPLGGLIAGMKFARDNDRELLLAVPCDMPFLPDNLLDRLAAALGDHACALASSGGHVHPVCGLWRTSSFDQIGDYVASGRRSVKGLAKMIGWVEVAWAAAQDQPFFNINTALDLAQAERRIDC